MPVSTRGEEQALPDRGTQRASRTPAAAAGPTMVVYGFGDVIAPAKAVTDYAKTARNAFAPKTHMDGAIAAGASSPSWQPAVASSSSRSWRGVRVALHVRELINAAAVVRAWSKAGEEAA
jgi:pimeloyl-ACP methyl ester carboxylesterase